MSIILWFAVFLGLGTGAVLALLTFMLWDLVTALSVYQYPVMFVVGMLPITVACALWASAVQVFTGRIDPLDEALAFGYILALGGLCDIAAYGWQYWRHRTNTEAVLHPPRHER